MIEQLRETCRKLLQDQVVDVFIGYGQSRQDGPVHAVFINKPDDAVKLVWNKHCFPNLTVYLTRPEMRAQDNRVGIMVKGCDARSLMVLEQERQIDRELMHVVGMACDGVGDPTAPKCLACKAHTPKTADTVIGVATVPDAENDGPAYPALAAFLQKTPAERMAFWKSEFKRCIKCYACRAVCPTCYCNQCVVDKNQPACVDTSATLMGNFAWHITRAFHQAGRCSGCGECSRVCPAGINLALLNQSLARAAEENFGYRSGANLETPPPIGSYSTNDKETFIL